MSDDPRGRAMRALSRFLVSDASVGDTLLRVAEISAEAVPAAEMAGVSILDDEGKPTTAVFTDVESPEIDAGQYKSGKGPCLEAWRLQRPVRIDDMSTAASEYPDFARLAQERGVQSTLSLPLIAGATGIGALNLYARTVKGFSVDDEALAGDLAGAAAIVLANATAYWDARRLGEQLTEAMQSRAMIEQAKGMLMAQSPGITADDAFDLLRRASQRENVKLREVAMRIVERRSLSGTKE